MPSLRFPPPGIRRLSELEIDISKDWLGYIIKNLGAPIDPKDAARKTEVDTHKTAIPIDHPDESVSDVKLADLSTLRFTPDGRIKPMSDAVTRIFFVTRNIAEDVKLDHIFAPTDDGYGCLGDNTHFWYEAYIRSGWIEDWYIRYWIDPWEDNIPSWGARNLRHRYFYLGKYLCLQADLATATETLKNSAECQFAGEYWDGTKSVFRLARIYHEMLSTVPESRLVFEIALKKVLMLSDKGGIDGQFRIDDDTYAGQVTTDADGNATVTFTEHMGTTKPTVILTPEFDPKVDTVFAQITGWTTDAEGNYTGFTIRTTDDGGRPQPSVPVHYLAIRKSVM